MKAAEALAEIRGRLGQIAPLLSTLAARHRFWLESAGITFLALIVLTAFGIVAMRRTAEWEEQVRALRALETGMITAASEFQPVDSTERGDWAESERVLTNLQVQASDPLTVAGIVAQRSEEIGISSLRVRLDQGSGTGAVGQIRTGEWIAEPQPTVIVADFTGSALALSRFVGVLPPHVEVEAMRTDTIGGIRRNEVRLVVRTVEGPD